MAQLLAGINCLYITHLRCLDKWTKGQKTCERFSSRFTWISRGEPPKWDDVGPSLQFPMNNGVSVEGVKCFDQLIDLKKKKSSQKVSSATNSLSVYWHTACGPDIFEN